MDEKIEKKKKLVSDMTEYADKKLTRIKAMWASDDNNSENLITLWLCASELAHAFKVIYDTKKEIEAI